MYASDPTSFAEVEGSPVCHGLHAHALLMTVKRTSDVDDMLKCQVGGLWQVPRHRVPLALQCAPCGPPTPRRPPWPP